MIEIKIGDKLKYIGSELNHYYKKGEIIKIIQLPNATNCFKHEGEDGGIHRDWLTGSNHTPIQFKKMSEKINNWREVLQ